MIKKNLAKEATNQAIGELKGKQKSEENMQQSCWLKRSKLKSNLKKKKIVFNLLRRSDQTDVLLVQLQPKDCRRTSKQFGIKVDKRHIELEHPIRAIGLIEVPVKLHKEVSAQIKLNIKNSAE